MSGGTKLPPIHRGTLDDDEEDVSAADSESEVLGEENKDLYEVNAEYEELREETQQKITAGNQMHMVLRKPADERTKEDLASLEEILLKVNFGMDLPDAKRIALCRHLQHLELAPGATVFKQGEAGDEFFIILKGSVIVSLADDPTRPDSDVSVIAQLFEGDGFGELALMTPGATRRATVTCKNECDFAVLHRSHYDAILRSENERDMAEKVNFLKGVPIFCTLPTSKLEQLAAVLTRREVMPKQVIMRQADEMEDMFFVYRGSVKMVREMRKDFAPDHVSQNSTLPGSDGNFDQTGRRRRRGRATGVRSRVADMIHGRAPLRGPPRGEESLPKLGREGGGKKGDRAMSHMTSMVQRSSGLMADMAEEEMGYQNPLKGEQIQRNPSALLSGISKLRKAVSKQIGPKLPSQLSAANFRQVVNVAAERQKSLKHVQLTDEMVQMFQHSHKIELPDRIFLEVASAGRYEYFAERCVQKNSRSTVTIITTSFAVVYLLNKWDLLKRLDKDTLATIMENSQSTIDEDALKEQYVKSLQWDTYKRRVVHDVISHKHIRSTLEPAYCWAGPFRAKPEPDIPSKPLKYTTRWRG